MIIVLKLEEAKIWAKNNLYDADSYLNPLQIAVKNGLLKDINGGEFFAVVEHTTETGVTWHLDEIRRLSNKEMKENDLYCRYRYKSHVVSAPEGYDGAKHINAGLRIEDKRDEKYPLGLQFYLEGDSRDYGISGYEGKISTFGKIINQPSIYEKKVLVILDSIDGEKNVPAYISKGALRTNAN